MGYVAAGNREASPGEGNAGYSGYGTNSDSNTGKGGTDAHSHVASYHQVDIHSFGAAHDASAEGVQRISRKAPWLRRMGLAGIAACAAAGLYLTQSDGEAGDVLRGAQGGSGGQGSMGKSGGLIPATAFVSMAKSNKQSSMTKLTSATTSVGGDYDIWFTAGAWGRSYVYRANSVTLNEVEMLVGAGSYSNSLAVYTADGATSLFLTAVSEDGGENGRGSVIRSSVDATSTETILDLESSEPFGIDLDADEEQIYWCEKDKEAVIRSDLHGTKLEAVIWSVPSPVDVKLHSATQRLYVSSADGAIFTATTSGTEHRMLTNASCAISGIDIYPAAEELYYACEDSVYKVSSTTGGSRSLLVDGFGHVSSIAIAVDYDTLWVADDEQDTIFACRLNGTSCEAIYSVETPRFLDITSSVSVTNDDVDDMLADTTSSSIGAAAAESPTLSPTSKKPSMEPTEKPTKQPSMEPTTTPIVTPTVPPTRKPTTTPTAKPTLAPSLEPTPAAEFFSYDVLVAADITSSSYVYELIAKKDGAELVESQATVVAAFADGIAVDQSRGVVFYTDQTNAIYKTPMVTSEDLSDDRWKEKVYSYEGTPRGLDLDVAANMLYWVDDSNAAIYRGAGDGTGSDDFEAVVTGLMEMKDVKLTFDADTGECDRMFISTTFSNSIYTCSCDGDDLTEFIVGYSRVVGLAVDVGMNVLFWADESEVYMADLTTGELLDKVATDFTSLAYLALDTAKGKLFMTDEGGDAVWAMDLDGRTLQKLAELDGPRGIAIMANSTEVEQIQEIEAEVEAVSPTLSPTSPPVPSPTVEPTAHPVSSPTYTTSLKITAYTESTSEDDGSVVVQLTYAVGQASTIRCVVRDEDGGQVSKVSDASVDAGTDDVELTIALDDDVNTGCTYSVRCFAASATLPSSELWSEHTVVDNTDSDSVCVVELAAPDEDPEDEDEDKGEEPTTFDPNPEAVPAPTPSAGQLTSFYFTAGGASSSELWFQEMDSTGAGAASSLVFDESFRTGDLYAAAYCYQDRAVYFSTSSQGIYRSDETDSGNELTLLFQNGPSSEVRGLDIDPFSGQIYWVDYALGHIMKGNTDGSSVDMVHDGFVAAHDVKLRFNSDEGCDSMYVSTNDGIFKADCDGNGMVLLVSHSAPKGLAIDHLGGHLYYIDGSSTVFRVGWDDGEDVTALANPFMGSFSSFMDIDPVGQTLYMADSAWNTIWSMNMQTEEMSMLVSMTSPLGVALVRDRYEGY